MSPPEVSLAEYENLIAVLQNFDVLGPIWMFWKTKLCRSCPNRVVENYIFLLFLSTPTATALLAPTMTTFNGHTFATCTTRDESTDMILLFIFIQLAIGLLLIIYSTCGRFSVDEGNDGSHPKYSKDGDQFLSRNELLEFEADLNKHDMDGGVFSELEMEEARHV